MISSEDYEWKVLSLPFETIDHALSPSFPTNKSRLISCKFFSFSPASMSCSLVLSVNSLGTWIQHLQCILLGGKEIDICLSKEISMPFFFIGNQGLYKDNTAANSLLHGCFSSLIAFHQEEMAQGKWQDLKVQVMCQHLIPYPWSNIQRYFPVLVLSLQITLINNYI